MNEKMKEDKKNSIESYTRICVATIIVLWDSICNDNIKIKKKNKEDEEKKIKEEKEESKAVTKNIS